MKHQRNIEGLRQNAQKKKQDAIERTEKGIQQLIKEGRSINFKTVAEVADVSTAWLYKEPEIKARIEHLRDQGTRKKKSVPTNQKANDASNNSKYQALKQRIQKVEAENRGLRDHLEAIHGRQRSLVDENEGLRREIERLTKLLAESRAETESLKQGSSLPSQLNEQASELDEDKPKQLVNKVTPLKSRPTYEVATEKATNKLDMINIVKLKLEALGVPLSSTLAKTIKSATESTVINAMGAFEEALLTENIKKPGAWLKIAIDEGWKPNESLSVKGEVQTKDERSQWFELAKAQGIVKAKQQTETEFSVQDNTGQWASWESYVERGWTLEYLKRRAKQR